MKILYLLLVSFCLAFGLEGRVIKVIDGDTINILTKENEVVKIRLFGIDAPELKEKGGKRSKRHLNRLIGDKKVKVQTHGYDKYRRVLGVIYFKNTDINGKMITDGYAKAALKYSKRYKDF
ncbi:thermonuclease family protein [Campylobacter sp. faydin G-105]|uniref:thermonuclease family protein n=1 Tax=Campylobacter anatolicus TaxID=2829105 RepID=UPI001BA09512|nr:thermonuclease family protein [Campylobacter anatolicus]MBR8461593.1 thermonuclease family protein [Campylobacter anatolicus]